METISIPPPLPPKTRKKPCSGGGVIFQEQSSPELDSKCRYDHSAALTAPPDRVHVVSIRVRPEPSTASTVQGCVRISVGRDMMTGERDPYLFVMTTGQSSPSDCTSDQLDSGTCSDADGRTGTTPPPLPKKAVRAARTATCVTVNGSSRSVSGSVSGSVTSGGEHESDDERSSNMSCDSLNSLDNVILAPPAWEDRNNRNNDPAPVAAKKLLAVEERTYEEREAKQDAPPVCFDKYYDFHLNEKDSGREDDEEDTFAGCKDYTLDEPVTVPATIRSSKGTVRGVKNRVRAGVATFLSIHSNKSWKDKEAGKVVVFTTTMGVVRGTYQRCVRVKQILRTLLVRFDEKDVFMSREVQAELMERMRMDTIQVPQVFVEGQHVGDAETIERLNESGELRKMLKPYKSADVCSTCEVCGGYRLLPCAVCNGSKKSVHRNNFTAELVALRCMNCDEVGLVKCYAC